jgi:hypothetical protein
LIGIILATGIGDIMANTLSPLASSPIGLVILSLIVGFPVLTSRLSTPCPPYSPSTPRWGVTSSPLAWPWARQNLRLSRSASQQFCSLASSQVPSPSSWPGWPAQGSTPSSWQQLAEVVRRAISASLILPEGKQFHNPGGNESE